MKILEIIIGINLIMVIFLFVNWVICKRDILSSKVIGVYDSISKAKIFRIIENDILLLEKNNKLNKKRKIITPASTTFVSVILGCLTYFFILKTTDIISTSLILALTIFVTPFLVIKLYIKKEKKEIKKQLPQYIINLKNHVENSNSVVLAMQNTQVEEPIKKYVDRFNISLKRGLGVYPAFKKLGEEINVKTVTSFINAIYTCYINGGDAETVLDKFSNIITKENLEKEKLKENSYTAIITLGIMLIINIYLIIGFVFSNGEYLQTIKSSGLGKIIVNFSIFTYIFIGYLMLKIYGMED